MLTIKGKELLGKVVELEGTPVGMACAGPKEIYVGFSSDVVTAYTLKGKKTCSFRLDEGVLNLDVFKRGRDRALVVAAANGDVRLYKKRHLVQSSSGQAVLGMRCGRYGRSDVSLATVYRNGAVRVQILRRTAELQVIGGGSGSEDGEAKRDGMATTTPSSLPSLAIPKRTRLYVEQAEREREHAGAIHRIFQNDLRRLRLTSAEAYVKLLNIRPVDSASPSKSVTTSSEKATVDHLSAHATARIGLAAEVRGLGPAFDLAIDLRTEDETSSLRNVRLVVTYDPKVYVVDPRRRSVLVPILVPGASYRYRIRIESISPDGAAGAVRVLVCRDSTNAVLRSLEVTMPLSEEAFE